ncbi:MAG: carboxypeptidase-like regulatory domain-containing protein [Polyangiales bacterium]
MRTTLLVALLLCIPALASAQQDQTVIDRVTGNVPDLVTSVSDAELPAGTIAVEVVDAGGRPVPKQAVRLGLMEKSGSRESKACVTDDEGRCSFDGLATESMYSYRVNVPYEGARYSSTPFRLDPANGQRVRVVRLPTTTDSRRVFQVVGRTMIEFQADRAHITQEARLANLGDETYVLPAGGMPLRLPSGFKAFDSMAVMTDQRLTATDDGLEISGSIPPGRVDLTWAYDIPISGTSISIEQAVPFATMEYQVISDFVDGMSMEVEGFQVARVHEGGDRRFLVASLMRRPGEPPIDPLRIHIRGIPGGGPLPYLAVAFALILIGFGVVLLLRPSDQTVALTKARGDRREELLDAIASLERQRKAEAIGPSYYTHRRRELTDELATVLRMQREATSH